MSRLTILHASVIFICMSILWLHKVEGSECSAISHPNGTTTFHLHDTVSYCNKYNWCVNGTVVANEDDRNHTMVLSRDPHGITFKTCYYHITYRNVCNGKIITCSSCHTNPSTKVPSIGNRGHADAAVIFVILCYNIIFIW